MKLFKFQYILAGFIIVPQVLLAQIEVNNDGETMTHQDEAPRTGKKEAQKYFLKRKKSGPARAPKKTSSSKISMKPSGERYLSLHMGMAFDEEVYRWGQRNDKDLTEGNIGVTYRMGEWVNSMDASFRADITSFDLAQGKAVKLSLLPIVTFPDVRSGFPLYFGAGAGAGIFFKQVDGESHISLDYQLLAGARVFNVLESMGVFAEVGLKNHFHLLTDGQYNGAFFSLGVVFDF